MIDCLGRLAYQKAATLILMGISEKEEWRQLLLGSNTVKMAEQNICPVMIIPEDARFNGIKNIALASDVKDVDVTTPVLAIKTVLEIFSASLHIVNVDSEHYVEVTEEYKAERAKLETILAGYETEYYFMRQFDFVDAINQFVADYKIDMIFTVPKNHSFLGSLFKSSHTKKLAYHSHVPLVAIHE